MVPAPYSGPIPDEVEKIRHESAAIVPVNGTPPDRLDELSEAGWIERWTLPHGEYLSLTIPAADAIGIHLVEVRGRARRKRARELIAETPTAQAWLVRHLIRADPGFAAAAQGDRTLRGHVASRLRRLRRSAEPSARRRADRLLAAWRAARGELNDLASQRWAPLADPGPVPWEPREPMCANTPPPSEAIVARDWRIQEELDRQPADPNEMEGTAAKLTSRANRDGGPGSGGLRGGLDVERRRRA